MTDAMFELPSEKDVKQFKVTRSFVEEKLEHTQVSKLKAA
jgi:ATP-dependent protease Clp ATPase subunit